MEFFWVLCSLSWNQSLTHSHAACSTQFSPAFPCTPLKPCCKLWLWLTWSLRLLPVLRSCTGRQWTQRKRCKEKMLPQNTTARILVSCRQTDRQTDRKTDRRRLTDSVRAEPREEKLRRRLGECCWMNDCRDLIAHRGMSLSSSSDTFTSFHVLHTRHFNPFHAACLWLTRTSQGRNWMP